MDLSQIPKSDLDDAAGDLLALIRIVDQRKALLPLLAQVHLLVRREIVRRNDTAPRARISVQN
jgi:hypothetical protein